MSSVSTQSMCCEVIGEQNGTIAATLDAARPRLMQLARLRGVPQHAVEDIAQETLLVAWRQRATLRDPERCDAWLDGICRNLCRMHHRSHYAAGETLPVQEDDGIADLDLDDELEHHDLEMLIDQALGYLPEMARRLVELRYLHDLTPAELAERLGVALGTMEVRLHRARRQLRAIFDSHLRGEAAALGLPIAGEDDQAGWRETREWCHVCGKRYMFASFETMPGEHVNFRLRCPSCSPAYDSDIHNSQGIVRLGDLRSVRPALKRTIRHVNARYLAALTAPDHPCLVCGAPQLAICFADSPEMGHAPPYGSALHLRCQHCGFANCVWMGGVAMLSHPDIAAHAERFIMTHPRWIMLPDQRIIWGDMPAIRYRIGDSASNAEIAIVAKPQSLHVLATHIACI